MSTAVLEGCACMIGWLLMSTYVQLAVEHATNLKQLRAERDSWRQKIQSSPLEMLPI